MRAGPPPSIDDATAVVLRVSAPSSGSSPVRSPLEYRHRMVVVFVRGFIDRSETFEGAASTMSVAAWVGPVWSWEMFDRLWRECRAEAKIKKFHMTDYVRRKGVYSCWQEEKRHAVVDALLALTNST